MGSARNPLMDRDRLKFSVGSIIGIRLKGRNRVMNDAELWELILISQGNMSSAMAVYLPVLSGYLIVAYLIGQKLSTFQYIAVTGLFTVSALILTFGCCAFLIRAAFLLEFTDEKYRSPASAFIPFAPQTIAALLLLGIVACLKFMWDVRHPRAE